MVNFAKYKPFAPLIVRLSISLVFLWFGLSQLFNGSAFMGYVPKFATELIPLAPTMIVFVNGLFDAIFGFLLLIGLFTRPVAFLLIIHLLIIILGLGYNDIAARDFGLMLITFSIFVNGPDGWTFDMQVREKLKKSMTKAGGSFGDKIGIKIKMK